MDELFQYLENLSPLSAELRAILVTRLQKETYRKKKTILHSGQICDWIAFIERGLVKVCYDIPGGGEHIISFIKAGETVCAIKSCNQHLPSRVSIVALDEVVMRKIRRVEVDWICDKYPDFNVHLRKIVELQSALIEDHYMLLTLPPKERVARLEAENSWILGDRRIWGYAVANYLGIEQSTYSKFRNGR